MNAKRKCLKRFKGVGKNLKAKIIASCRELWCSRGFSAEMDMGLNLVLFCWIPAVTWDEDKFHHCSSFIVFLPQTYLWKCHKMVLPNALRFRKCDIQQIRRNYYFFSYSTASWHKFSIEMVKISAHFTGLGLLINIQQSNFTQSHILTA